MEPAATPKRTAGGHTAKSSAPIANPVILTKAAPTPTSPTPNVTHVSPTAKPRAPGVDANGQALPLPRNAKPLPAHPPKPGSGTTVQDVHHSHLHSMPSAHAATGLHLAQNASSASPLALGGSRSGELFDSSPLLTSQELSAPVGKSWDALAAGLGRGFGVPSNLTPLPSSSGIHPDLPLLANPTPSTTFSSLAGMNDSDLIFPTSSPIGSGASPIDPLWLGTPVDMQAPMLGASQNQDSFMDFQSLLSVPLLSPNTNTHLSATSHLNTSANHADQGASGSQNGATGLRGLLSDEDEVVAGHVLPNGSAAHSYPSNPSSVNMRGTLPNLQNLPSSAPQTHAPASSLFLNPSAGMPSTSSGHVSTSNGHDSAYGALPTFSNFGAVSLFSSTDAFPRSPSLSSGQAANNSTGNTGVDQIWSGFPSPAHATSSHTPATTFSSLLSMPPGFDTAFSSPMSYHLSSDGISSSPLDLDPNASNPGSSAFYQAFGAPNSSSNANGSSGSYYSLFSQ
jgi:hypothetical protein